MTNWYLCILTYFSLPNENLHIQRITDLKDRGCPLYRLEVPPQKTWFNQLISLRPRSLLHTHMHVYTHTHTSSETSGTSKEGLIYIVQIHTKGGDVQVFPFIWCKVQYLLMWVNNRELDLVLWSDEQMEHTEQALVRIHSSTKIMVWLFHTAVTWCWMRWHAGHCGKIWQTLF